MRLVECPFNSPTDRSPPDWLMPCVADAVGRNYSAAFGSRPLGDMDQLRFQKPAHHCWWAARRPRGCGGFRQAALRFVNLGRRGGCGVDGLEHVTGPGCGNQRQIVRPCAPVRGPRAPERSVQQQVGQEVGTPWILALARPHRRCCVDTSRRPLSRSTPCPANRSFGAAIDVAAFRGRRSPLLKRWVYQAARVVSASEPHRSPGGGRPQSHRHAGRLRRIGRSWRVLERAPWNFWVRAELCTRIREPTFKSRALSPQCRCARCRIAGRQGFPRRSTPPRRCPGHGAVRVLASGSVRL